MRISSALAYQVFDSRGFPTIAVKLESEGKYAIGMSPSGASTGSHEAFEMRDLGVSFLGKGVTKAVALFNEQVAPLLKRQDFDNQKSFDQFLIEKDGSNNFENIGGNTAIAASIAFLRLTALLEDKEVYQVLAEQWNYTVQPGHIITPLVNVINGGKHASSGLAIQEVMLVPMIGITTTEKIMIAGEIFNTLRSVLREKGMSTLVGDEGGFAPDISYLEEVVELISAATAQAGLKFGADIKVALDSAATEFFHDGAYHLEKQEFTAEELVKFYVKAAKDFHIISLEDPFAEDDFVAWKMLSDIRSSEFQVVGDDLTVTNVERMKLIKDHDLVSAMIVKPNQIGTISQTMAAIQLAQQYDWKPILSHRSGETEDTTIADIAVAVGAPFIKTGSMSRSERMCKYNRLIGIQKSEIRNQN